MTSVTEISRHHAAPALGTFERYLTLWVALCIIAGIVLGRLVPGPLQALGRMTVAEVNMPVAVLIWLMIVPMLLKVDFGALHRVAEQWRGIAVTVGINWLVKPFSMAVLGWLFVGWLFRPWLPGWPQRYGGSSPYRCWRFSRRLCCCSGSRANRSSSSLS